MALCTQFFEWFESFVPRKILVLRLSEWTFRLRSLPASNGFLRLSVVGASPELRRTLLLLLLLLSIELERDRTLLTVLLLLGLWLSLYPSRLRDGDREGECLRALPTFAERGWTVEDIVPYFRGVRKPRSVLLYSFGAG